MAFDVPTQREIYQRIITDIISSYNTSSDTNEHIDPSLRNNPEGAFAYALSQQSDSINKLINRVVNNLFVDTAEDEFLDRLATLVKLSKNPATTATGSVTFTGNTGLTIPNGISLTKTDGTLYTTQASAITATQSISVSSLTRSGTTATATTSATHTIGVGMEILIAGANETDYNGTFTVVSIPALNQFTYAVSGSPSTPATGTITASYVGVSVAIESNDAGADSNIASGGTLTIATPIAGVDNIVYTQFAGISGGTNEETTEDFRDRVIFKWQNPATPFSSTAIESLAKEVSGVTRVWVEEITPDIGKVTIYFVRDDDASIIPDSGEVATVKEKILTIKPAHTPDSYVIVSAPAAVAIPITFSVLSPNTSEMQTAITASLQEFFTSENNVGENVELNQITNTIFNTIDDTGSQPTSFTLSAPAGDTIINAGQIGTLGTIIYP
jgi:uncharacterized phage protein gp47/JayE